MSVAHLTELLFIGFFTAAGLYSALLFLITRDPPFLWYAALMDTTAAAQLVFAPDPIRLAGRIRIRGDLSRMLLRGRSRSFLAARFRRSIICSFSRCLRSARLQRGTRRAGQDDARYHVAGYAGALFGAAASALSQTLALGAWPEYFFQFGVAWQGALLGLALASRYTRLDPLTGAKSRRAFDERLSTVWRAAFTQRAGLAVIVVAIGYKRLRCALRTPGG